MAAVITGLVAIGLGVVWLYRRYRRASTRFDPQAMLAHFLRQVEQAATDVARERGWDEETRIYSAGQVFGLLSKGVLNACDALKIPPPALNEFARMSLKLAGHPLLSTAAVVSARLKERGVIPSELATSSDDTGEDDGSLEADMAARAMDAPIRQAMGLLPFRVDGVGDRSAEGEEVRDEDEADQDEDASVPSPSIESYALTQFGRFCAAAAFHTTGRKADAGIIVDDLRVADVSLPLVVLAPLSAAFRIQRHVRTEPSLKDRLQDLQEDVLLFEAAAFAYSTVFHGIPATTLGQFMITDYVIEAGGRLEDIIRENTAIADPHELISIRMARYGADIPRNMSALARVLLLSRGEPEPLTSVSLSKPDADSEALAANLDSQLVRLILRQAIDFIVTMGDASERALAQAKSGGARGR